MRPSRTFGVPVPRPTARHGVSFHFASDLLFHLKRGHRFTSDSIHFAPDLLIHLNQVQQPSGSSIRFGHQLQGNAHPIRKKLLLS